MKNYIKAFVTFVFLMAAIAFVPAAADAAAAPSNLRQTGAGESSVDIAWDAVTGAKYYQISWSTDGVNWSTPGRWDYTINPEGTVPSLSAGSTYYVKVRASEDSSVWTGAYSQAFEVVTAPDADQMGTPAKADATSSSLTISWTACPGATSYNVYDYSTKTLLGATTTPSFTRTGLAADNSYSFLVYPVRTSSSGYAASAGYKYVFALATKPNTPVTPSTANFGLTSTFYNINVAYFGATDPSSSANGYEIEVSTVKGKKKVFTATSSNYRFTVTRNTAYKYRCRFYATYDNEKIYGNWSGYRYFCYQTVSGKKYSNRIKMSWKKVSAAKSYTVYISTKEKGGYKKVKKLSSKKTSLTIRKYGKKRIKKNGTYYVKVVANLKDGKQSVKSDTYYVGKTLSY